jgi:site-specific DNA-methyltransferase (adenine-specific)
MQILNIPLAALSERPANSRTHSKDQVLEIAASIREFGFTNPILIDETMEIIAGHGRVLAAASLGMQDVPCVLLEGLTEDQKRAYVIADNQIAMNAGWDMDKLAEEVRLLQDAAFDLNLLGFDDRFLDGLLLPDAPLEEDTGPPDPPANPVTKPGDVWICGPHKVGCGDSTSIDWVEGFVGGARVDLWLTDPPYNVGYVGKTKDALEISNYVQEDGAFRQFLRDAYSAADAVMKPGAVFYIWHADSEGFNFRGAARDVEWVVRQCLIWAKNTMVLGRQDYQWKHEPCLYGWKKGAGHTWLSDRTQTTLLEFKKPNRSGEHPTMKPIELFEYQIKNSCPRGGLVFDSFGGSGTTLIAAETTGRVAAVIELDPKYVDVIVSRWQKHTGAKAVLEGTSETFGG